MTSNDGECHLQRSDEGFYEYSRSPEQVRVFISMKVFVYNNIDFLCLLVVNL